MRNEEWVGYKNDLENYIAVSKKGKNRVEVNGREYLWWVFDEHDQTTFDGVQVKVVSSDQTHIFQYGLQQLDGDRQVVFALRDYKRLVSLTMSPKFENADGIITKSGIKRLIDWCLKGDCQVDYAWDTGSNQLSSEEKINLLSQLRQMVTEGRND